MWGETYRRQGVIQDFEVEGEIRKVTRNVCYSQLLFQYPVSMYVKLRTIHECKINFREGKLELTPCIGGLGCGSHDQQ